MSATLAAWRASGERELPWLAGCGLAALSTAAVQPAQSPFVRRLERFLVGAEPDASAVLDAIDRCVAEAGEEGPPVPPDARGALLDVTDRFFDLLAEAYGAVHQAVQARDRDRVEDVTAQWQRELDAAAADIEDRVGILLGLRDDPGGRSRGVPDHPGLALGFVILALLTAAVIMWLVLQGWPMQ